MNWEYLIIHHTGAEEKDTEQIRRYHKSLGWRDIGYNYVIERNGLVVPGRPLEMPGAHCRAAGMNRKGIGVALIGNLEEHPPRAEQVSALIELLACLMQQHRIPAQNVLGHREVPDAATTCPGKYFPLDNVREKVQVRQDQTIQGINQGNNQAWPASATPKNAIAEMPAAPEFRTDHNNANEKTASNRWFVQVGAFSSRERAELYAKKLREQGIEVIIKKEIHQ